MIEITNQIKIDDLPEDLQAIARIIGINDLISLSEGHGGNKIYIPSNPNKNHPVRKYLSPQSAKKLIDQFRGCFLHIPRKNTLERNTRNRMICDDYINGITIANIAIRYKISDNTVRNIISKFDVTNSL